MTDERFFVRVGLSFVELFDFFFRRGFSSTGRGSKTSIDRLATIVDLSSLTRTGFRPALMKNRLQTVSRGKGRCFLPGHQFLHRFEDFTELETALRFVSYFEEIFYSKEIQRGMGQSEASEILRHLIEIRRIVRLESQFIKQICLSPSIFKLTGMATTLRGINSWNCRIVNCHDLILIRSSKVKSMVKCPSV